MALMIEPVVSLAFSVYSNRGTYALLLGSGVSRAAGIPTGWEVVLDFIRKLAELQGENCEPSPEEWFRQKHGVYPDYSQLLDALAHTPTERQQILRSYFEPTQDDRQQGLKLPTDAHKAVARLVAGGYVRVVITTNFDRLLEKALEDIGVAPVIISTADQVAGALPLVHAPVTLIKLHGDYLDTRIRNTPEELAAYAPCLDRLLDQVLDEYGLVVCGWSADWDTALRAAMERCPSRRFTTFWASRSPLSERAQRLAENRKAQVIQIADASRFFQELGDRVAALADLAAPHPLSPKIASAMVKRYLVDPSARIRLHDFVQAEADRLVVELQNPELSLRPPDLTFAVIVARASRYEALSDMLISVLTTGCYWGTPHYADMWWKCLQRAGSLPERPDYNGAFTELIKLQSYPALLLLYGGGLAALAAGDYTTFARLLSKPRVDWNDGEGLQPLLLKLWAKPVSTKPGPNGSLAPSSLSGHLYELFRARVRELLPSEEEFRQALDRLEYFIALLRFDMSKGSVCYWGGGWDRWRFGGRERDIRRLVDEEIAQQGDECPYLKAGLFDGKAARLMEVKTGLEEKMLRPPG